MKVGVVIITYNLSSEIFMLQIAAIKKYCKDEDYDILIVDNSSDLAKAEDIRYHAEKLGVSYIKTFAGGMGSDSHAFAAKFSYQRYKYQYEYFLFLDHDAIPVQDFSAVQILSGGHIAAGIGQGAKKKYLWPGLFFLNNSAVDKDIVDFSPSSLYNLDTGGNLYLLVEKYGEDHCIFFNEAYHENPFFKNHRYSHYTAINNGMFFHLTNASNWADTDRQEERINAFINVVKEKTGL